MIDGLKTAIRESIKSKLGYEIKTISFVEVDNDEIIIEIELTFSPKRLPKDIMVQLVSQTASVVRQSGEHRYPIVLPQLSNKQSVAA